MEKYLPIAAWYTGGRTRATMVRAPGPGDRVRWKKDLQAIKNSGFNSVRLWVDWSSGEPQPGEYNFAALDLTRKLATDVGLRYIVQLYLDSSPDWLPEIYPDCHYVAAGEQAIVSQVAPGYCYDHPGVKRACEGFMMELAARLKDDPGFLAWDLWSEPHIVQWGYFDFLPQPAVFCYCQSTQQRFRDYLRRKYGKIEALNKAWYRTYTSWDSITAPKFVSLMTYTDYLDWLSFLTNKLAEDLRWRHDTVRRGGSTQITTSHSAIPCIMTTPVQEQTSPDDWLMAKQVNIWGTSLYPLHVGAKESNHPTYKAANLAATRSSCDAAGGKPYWLGELQGGHGYVGMFASHATKEDSRLWTWGCLAHGAKGLNFYAWYPMSTGYESGGFGLANLDGTPTDRALEVGAICKTVDKNMADFAEAKAPKAQAAILWSIDSNYMWVCMRQTWGYIPSRSMLGSYRALFYENLPADFIHSDQIINGSLSDYKVLYMPFSLMLPAKAAQRIAEWVYKGGVLIGEARTAWNDENGECGVSVPGLGLEKVFGCRERGALSIEETKMVITADHPNIPWLSAGDEVAGAHFQQSMEPISKSAKVVAEFEDGQPAMIANRYGKGRALFVGTMLSFAYYKQEDENAGKVLAGLTEVAGLKRPIEMSGVKPRDIVEPRYLVGRDKKGKSYYIFFLLNHSAHSQEPEVALGLRGKKFRVKDLVTGRQVKFARHGDRLILKKKLASRDVWLVKIAVL
jgi:beta-galactosidase